MKDYNPYRDEGKIYSVKEVADLYWASTTTVYRWLKLRRIKSRKYKKRYKITGKQLRAFSIAPGHRAYERYYYANPYPTIFRRKKPYPEPLRY